MGIWERILDLLDIERETKDIGQNKLYCLLHVNLCSTKELVKAGYTPFITASLAKKVLHLERLQVSTKWTGEVL